jgi:hypothetical protein
MNQTETFNPESLPEYKDWLQDRKEWMQEQDSLSDDKWIVCARDEDWE